eukprot:1223500-Rhodomonas_salina.2
MGHGHARVAQPWSKVPLQRSMATTVETVEPSPQPPTPARSPALPAGGTCLSRRRSPSSPPARSVESVRKRAVCVCTDRMSHKRTSGIVRENNRI